MPGGGQNVDLNFERFCASLAACLCFLVCLCLLCFEANKYDDDDELALDVQRWTRARSECLPGPPKIIVTPLTAVHSAFCDG